MPTRKGSFRLFKLFGIDVFLHWSWFLLAFYIYGIQGSKDNTLSMTLLVLIYLTLFLIVLLHEFGHALACRSVGGQANQIVLWPLGGVAYVSPPQRPGAVLWSIFAGPLVNIILVPILSIIWWIAAAAGWEDAMPAVYTYVYVMWLVNLVLLIFNMLPIYPLDGGKILYALLWFVLGRARSLFVATILGLIGIAGLFAFAIWTQSPLRIAVCVFIFLNCIQGLLQAREMLRMAKAPRNESYHCPLCQAAPPAGDFWTCAQCRKKFDLFANRMTCPNCQTQYGGTICYNCGMGSRLSEWAQATPPATPELPVSRNPA
jgi:Zn-dependent protease